MRRVFVASYFHYYIATSFTGDLLIATTQIYFHIALYSTLFKKYVIYLLDGVKVILSGFSLPTLITSYNRTGGLYGRILTEVCLETVMS